MNQSLVKQVLLAIVGHDLETNTKVKRWSLLMGAPPSAAFDGFQPAEHVYSNDYTLLIYNAQPYYILTKS